MAYTRNGRRYDDNNVYIGPASGADYMGAESPFDTPLSAADIQRQQKQAMGEYAIAGGMGVAAELGQAGLSLIDTSADIANKAETKTLQDRAKKGKLGLTDTERAHYEATLLNPVRAMSSEAQLADESRIAARGQGASAADLVRSQREGRKRITDATIDAGQKIEAAHLQEAQREATELNERLATEAGRERQRIERIGQAVAGLAANAGKVMAAGATKARVTDGQIMQMMGAKNADGTPVYPGLKGMNFATARKLVDEGDMDKIMMVGGVGEQK